MFLSYVHNIYVTAKRYTIFLRVERVSSIEEAGSEMLDITYNTIWTFSKASSCKFKQAGGTGSYYELMELMKETYYVYIFKLGKCEMQYFP